MNKPFRDRGDAGRLLAEKLSAYANRPDVIVLALPRGGVPVAYEVARALNVSLDVFPVRKLGVPGHDELAMGAIAPGGVRVLNDEVVRALGIHFGMYVGNLQEFQSKLIQVAFGKIQHSNLLQTR